MDVQTLGIIAVVVAVVAVVVYVWDRRTKQQQIDWNDATKLAFGAGSVAGGVAYAVGTEGVSDVVETVTTAAQEMFVGNPSF